MTLRLALLTFLFAASASASAADTPTANLAIRNRAFEPSELSVPAGQKIELHVRNEKVRDLYFEEKIAPERGGGTWARMFVPGSMVDVALTPQHWGMYGT